jgi:putative ABC transport system ATP-binding protein
VQGFVLDSVTVRNGSTPLLDGIDGQLDAGQCTAIVGASGSGKSTLLRLLNRLSEPSSGRVLLDGVPLAELDVLQLRRRVALIAQQPVLLTDRLADELRVGRADLTDQRAAELLGRVGLPAEFARRRTSELSGGEAQRVCLARALAVEPQVLLLDEPTSALDGVNASLIVELARDHVRGGGTAVLVSHDLDIVRSAAQQVLVLEHGRLVAAGRPDEVDYLRTL